MKAKGTTSTAYVRGVLSGTVAREARTHEADAVLGLCRECHRPSFIDTAPPSIAEAVEQASQHMRTPKILPRSEAMRIWQAGVCECPTPGTCS